MRRDDFARKCGRMIPHTKKKHNPSYVLHCELERNFLHIKLINNP